MPSSRHSAGSRTKRWVSWWTARRYRPGVPGHPEQGDERGSGRCSGCDEQREIHRMGERGTYLGDAGGRQMAGGAERHGEGSGITCHTCRLVGEPGGEMLRDDGTEDGHPESAAEFLHGVVDAGSDTRALSGTRTHHGVARRGEGDPDADAEQ